MQKLLLILFTALLFFQTNAQTIYGFVQDIKGTAVPNATVQSVNSRSQTISGADGSFSITTNHLPDTLFITAVGYYSMSVPVNSTTITIKLEISATELETYTIANTGYEKIPKERATGSFDVLGKTQVNRRISPDIISRIQGMASSVAFNKSFAGQQINIRGVSTMFSGTEPLIIVDNFPYEGSLDNINPNDVENITILKDAAAASIWGARASNGVIVITTRSGRISQKAEVEVNANVTVIDKPNPFYLPVMSSAEMIEAEKTLFDGGRFDIELQYYPQLVQSPAVNAFYRQRNGEITAGELESIIAPYRSTDQRQQLTERSYRRAINQQYAVQLHGGGNTSAYYLGLGYDKSKGAFNDQSERISLDLHNQFNLNKKLQFNSEINYTDRKNKEGTLPGSVSKYFYEPLYDANGELLNTSRTYSNSFIEESAAMGMLNWNFNPIAEAALRNTSTKSSAIRLTSNIRYQLSKGLSASVQYQYQQELTRLSDIQNQQSYFVRDRINYYAQKDLSTGQVIAFPVPVGDILIENNSNLTAHNGRAQFQYQWQRDDHRLNIIAGGEIRETNSGGSSSTIYGYDPQTLSSVPVDFAGFYSTGLFGELLQIPGAPLKGSEKTDRFRSLFFNGSYVFKEKYILSASARKDASNLFGVRTNQRAVPLWSAGFKWMLNREKFYNVSWLPVLQMRTTYGYSGNINKSATAVTTMLYQGTNNYNLPYAGIVNPPNPSLRWEKTGMLNTGIDFSLKNNRISGSVEYYRKKSTDLFGSAPIDGTTGIVNPSGAGIFYGNVASIKANGWDVVIKTNNLAGAITWNTQLLFSIVKDKVSRYYLQPTASGLLSSYVSSLEGYPVQSLFAYAWSGLDPATGAPQGLLEGESSMDYANLNNPEVKDLQFMGSAVPRQFGSLLNEISFRGFSLSANISFKLNYWMRRPSIDYSDISAGIRGHADYALRWKKAGDENHTNIPAFNYPYADGSTQFYKFSSVLAQRGDHIRLQDVRASYSLPAALLKKIGANSIQVYFYMNNGTLLWKKGDYQEDPEFMTSMRTPVSYSGGINFSF